MSLHDISHYRQLHLYTFRLRNIINTQTNTNL